MAEIRLERRAVSGWVALMVLVLALAALATYWLWRSHPSAELVGFDVPPGYRDLVVAYEGRAWVPANVSQVALFPDRQMVEVGQAAGMKLYANSAYGMGGGGGGVPPPANLVTQPWGRIYVRVDEGRYLPLRWRTDGRR